MDWDTVEHWMQGTTQAVAVCPLCNEQIRLADERSLTRAEWNNLDAFAAAARIAVISEARLSEHLATHETVDWLRALRERDDKLAAVRAQLAQLIEELA